MNLRSSEDSLEKYVYNVLKAEDYATEKMPIRRQISDELHPDVMFAVALSIYTVRFIFQ